METFVGDTVKILIDTDIDLSGFDEIKILYRKPDGSIGEWEAAVCPDDDTYIQYQCNISTLDMSGTWKLQAFVSNDNEQYHGKWTDLIVLSPIT